MRKLFSPVITFDLRGLALFRIVLGLIVTVDLITRWMDLKWFYTDEGFWPRIFPFLIDGEYFFSLHMLDGSAIWQHFLFGIHLILALLFILGFKTRRINFFLWIFQLSLISRNFRISAGFDDYLCSLLLICLFLPLDKCLTISDWIGERKNKLDSYKYTSWINLLLLSQIFAIHFLAGWIKDGIHWIESNQALTIVYNNEHLTSELGKWLLNFPMVLEFLTPNIRYLELGLPFFLFFPFLFPLGRIIIVLSLLGLHLGIILTLNAWIFPYVNIAAVIPLIPSVFWDKVLPKKRWSFPFGKIKKYFVKNEFSEAPRAWKKLAASILILLIYIQITLHGTRREELPFVPKIVHQLALKIGFFQQWKLFGPSPIQRDGWFVFEGQTEDGKITELLGNDILLKEGRATSIPQYYPSRRWSKFLFSFPLTPNGEVTKNLAKTFCRLEGNENLSDVVLKYNEIIYNPEKKTKTIETHVLSQINCSFDMNSSKIYN